MVHKYYVNVMRVFRNILNVVQRIRVRSINIATTRLAHTNVSATMAGRATTVPWMLTNV